MTKVFTPFLIEIVLHRNIEDCPDALAVIRKSIMRDVFEGRDGPERLRFIIPHSGTAGGVLERYRRIADHPDVKALRVFSTSPNNASSLGILDPITSQLDNAWRVYRDRREAENVARANGATVKQMKRARGKPVMRDGRARKPPAKSDKQELHARADKLFSRRGKASPAPWQKRTGRHWAR